MTNFDLHRTVGEVVLRPIRQVRGTTTLGECARLLDARFDALIAFEPVRMISARDIVKAVAGRKPAMTLVDDLDLERVYCVPETTTLDDVLQCVTRAPSRRVIVQAGDGRLLGRLTFAALARALFDRPPWIDGLQGALHIEHVTEMEIRL